MKSLRLQNFRPASRRGFTIIELLVSIAITSLLVTLMLTIVTNVLNGWNRSSGSLSSGNQARMILGQLSQDLRSLVARKDGNVWLAATILPDSFTANGADWSVTGGGVIKPTGSASLSLPSPGNKAPWPDLATYRFGQAGTWLRFFTVRPDSNAGTDTVSAPRAVSYQIVRSKIGSAGTTYAYKFYRAEARPGPKTGGGATVNCTFNSGYNLFMAPGTPSPGFSYNTADNTAGNVGSILKPAASQLIGNNVIDFGVRVWTADPTANAPQFPNAVDNTGFAATTTVTGAGSFSPLGDGTKMTYGFPIIIEVMVRILTDDGAKQIENLESGKIVGDWWTIALANSNVYTRRIEITPQAF